MIEFPYIPVQNSRGEAGLRPLLPVILKSNSQTVETHGLLDTGADVNVLPYQIGLQLGAIWENQQTTIRLSGNLANYEARGLIVEASISHFQSVKLAFAWTQAENVPLILGQVNFFQAFDVCFFRSRSVFEIKETSG